MISRRRSKDVIRQRYLDIAQDYDSGLSLKDIKLKYKIKSYQTIYNAVDFVNGENK